MNTFCFIFLITPFILLANSASKKVWSEGRFPFEEKTIEVPFENKYENFSSGDLLKIEVKFTYPHFHNTSYFFKKVNEKLHIDTKQLFFDFIKQFKNEENKVDTFDAEAILLNFDQRKIDYFLTPTYASPSLVSIFATLQRFTGMPHGSSRYISYNYWFNEGELKELTLDDLFASNISASNYIIQFCLNTLKNEQVGYWKTDSAHHFPIEINEDDLKVFTLSKNGFTIIFQPYHIGGWADGPYAITITFNALKHLISPEGPLKELM